VDDDEASTHEDEGEDDEKGNALMKKSPAASNQNQVLSKRKWTDETSSLELSCLGTGYVNMSRQIK